VAKNNSAKFGYILKAMKVGPKKKERKILLLEPIIKRKFGNLNFVILI
jgi:hypothetical protein